MRPKFSREGSVPDYLGQCPKFYQIIIYFDCFPKLWTIPFLQPIIRCNNCWSLTQPQPHFLGHTNWKFEKETNARGYFFGWLGKKN